MNSELFETLRGRRADIIDKEKFRRAAVLVPLIEENGEYHLLFEVRSLEIPVQPGEISFPGGHISPEDKNPRETAIRETCEELGLAEEDIEIIAPLDVLITTFYTLVSPFVGIIKHPEKIVCEPSEVAEVFKVPLSFFFNNKPDIHQSYNSYNYDENFPFDRIPNAEHYENMRQYRNRVYFYYYEDRVIWGITARLAANLVEILNENNININQPAI